MTAATKPRRKLNGVPTTGTHPGKELSPMADAANHSDREPQADFQPVSTPGAFTRSGVVPAGSAATTPWPLGLAESDYNYDREERPQTRETNRWVGKPWRRIELLTYRHFYKGEQVGRNRDLTLHVGSRRLGLSVTLVLGRHDVLDYSDEEHQ